MTGQNQVALNLMELILTGPAGDGSGNAYGSTPCAGWVREFTSATVKVFRPGPAARSRAYFRMAQANGDLVIYFTGYTSMSDINTGTDPFPSAAPPSQTVDRYALLSVSASADATAREWMIAADDRTCIFCSRPQTTASTGRWYVAYFGEFFSYVPEDLYQSCILAAINLTGESNSPFGLYVVAGATAFDLGAFGNRTGVYVNRNYDGAASSIMGNYAFHAGVQPRQGNQYGAAIAGIFPALNEADGRFWYTHMPLCTEYTSPCVRGVLRGVWLSCSQIDYNADQDQFDVVLPDGTDATVELLYTYGSTDQSEPNTANKGNILIQISGNFPSS